MRDGGRARPSPGLGYGIEQERSEPHFPQHGAAASSSPSREELERQYAFYERFNAPPAGPRLRPVYVLAVLAAGAAMAVAGAWFLPPAATNHFDRDISHVVSDGPTSVVRSTGGVLRGIDPQELPYDGIPQDGDARVARKPPQEVAPEESSSIENSSGTGGTRRSVAASKAKDDPKGRSVAKQRARHVPESAPVAGKAKTSKKAAPKHRSARHATKDKEIERIKQQAADELKKKIESRPPVEQGAVAHRSVRQRDVPSTIDKATRTRAMLARCEFAGNFFLREKCKWQLCGGRWGKNGCPSYQTHPSAY